MKKVLVLILALAMVFALTACGGGGDTQTDDSNDAGTQTDNAGAQTDGGTESGGGDASSDIVIGFSISTLNNPFFVSMEEGARAKAAELGIQLLVVDAANDPAKQTSDIEDLVNSGINVLIVNPADSAAVAPVVRDAMEAGIKVIAVDRYVDDVDVDCYIGTDNMQAARFAGEYFVSQMEEGADIAVLEGVPGASSNIDRMGGYMQAIEGKLNVVATQTANYDRAEGLTVTEDILQANPNIKAILSMNDEMGLGAIEAVISAGKVPGVDIVVTGFDATDDAVAAVQEGTMLYTVEQQTVEMGETAVQKAVDFVNNVPVDANVPIDVELITP